MRRGTGRGLLIACLWLASLVPTSTALAASDIELKHAQDGTLVVVGSGWRGGQALVIKLGGQQFEVRADTSGDFELATGLSSFQGELSVHHPAITELAFLPLEAEPNPLAVLFARSIAEGMTLLGMVAGTMLVGLGVIRRVRQTRYPRQ